MSPSASIAFTGLRKAFKGQGAPALDGISAEIPAGAMTGLAGPDGAGKTTLMRILAGLMDRDAGDVTVLGRDPAKDAAGIQSRMGYMPQRFGLYEDLTVMENLSLYADIRGLSGAGRRARLAGLLEFSGLERFAARLAGKLSGGMKQKLGLACVLLGEPELLLLDEPSVGVDPISRRELWNMVRKLASGGVSVLWATSYLDEAGKSDWVLLLNSGKLVFSGRPCEAMGKAAGRSWAIEGVPAESRREALSALFRDGAVADASVRGSRLHVLSREEKPSFPLFGGSLRPESPSFEDAFISLLGGTAAGESALARRARQRSHDIPITVEARNLTRRFGDFTAVDDVSFSIGRGEIFALLGPNGAGKSTTFRMLCGLLAPSSGSALVAGIDLGKSASKARARLGFMAQKFSLYGNLSVGQNLDFFSGAYGLRGKERREEVSLMTEIFGLSPFLDRSAALLPLGYKRRLALACAVMHQPDALFLDEPTSGVDPVARREFWLHINHLALTGVAVLVSTHFLDEAECCDRVALILRGRNIATGTPDELKLKARTPSLPDPALEDAFFALVEANEHEL
ncbi:MAG: ATP-binding cassette domain-containing protein [Deltaproteobacteria bacterium]|jgi:ABC-2 type transport system ATP-binding protein|nr:ATP-binding cassette domain-containing protein [Deltaproteobacteria bacterium]